MMNNELQSIYIEVLKHGHLIKAAMNWDGRYRAITYQPRLDRYIQARDGEGIIIDDAIYQNEYQPEYNTYELEP
jgi:hypothetical protein